MMNETNLRESRGAANPISGSGIRADLVPDTSPNETNAGLPACVGSLGEYIAPLRMKQLSISSLLGICEPLGSRAVLYASSPAQVADGLEFARWRIGP
jgi:hypothetical protein